MADQENGAGQEPNPDANQGQEPDQQNPDQGQEPGGKTDQEFDLEAIEDPAVKAYVQRLQEKASKASREAARYRTERNGLQQKVTEHQRAGESAEEAQERERQERDQALEQLQRENRDLKVGATVRDEAAKAKAHNPARVWSIIQADVEVDDDGNPANVQDLLADLKRSDPYLFRRTDGDAGAGKGQDSTPPSDINSTIRAAAGRAT